MKSVVLHVGVWETSFNKRVLNWPFYGFIHSMVIYIVKTEIAKLFCLQQIKWFAILKKNFLAILSRKNFFLIR